MSREMKMEPSPCNRLLVLSVRGLLARSVLQAQAASPIFTHVYAALVAIINSKFPQIGELILKRLILTFRKSYRRNLKVPVCGFVAADQQKKMWRRCSIGSISFINSIVLVLVLY